MVHPKVHVPPPRVERVLPTACDDGCGCASRTPSYRGSFGYEYYDLHNTHTVRIRRAVYQDPIEHRMSYVDRTSYASDGDSLVQTVRITTVVREPREFTI